MSTQPEDVVLHSYVVAEDTGFAPNTTEGICTLATCKQVIRGEAEVGDWVVGTNPEEAGEERITYLMQVGEILTYEEYYSGGRFEFKKPENDPVGDNIYHRTDDGELVQVENPPFHDSDECREKDCSSNSVLVADRFWYFGEEDPELPPRLCDTVIKGYGSSSRSGRKKPTEHLDDLLEWITDRYQPGIHGDPRDGSANSCGSGFSGSSGDDAC